VPASRHQFGFEARVFAPAQHGVDGHGAHGQLLYARPGQVRRRQAFGEAAHEISGRIGARDVVEQICDIDGFQQMSEAGHDPIILAVCEHGK